MTLRLFIALALTIFVAMPAHAQIAETKAATPTEVTTEVKPPAIVAPAPVTETAPAETAAAPVEASDVVGTILGAEGTVSLLVAGEDPKPLKIDDVIHMNDVIETGVGSRAFIQLIDDTELTIGENAQITIDEYIFDEENPVANKARYSILKGAFLYTSGLLAKKENPDVIVNTPHGSIGIRGTTFWGGDIDGEYGILVTEGRVSVQTERGRILVDKGQGTSLRAKTSIPSRPAVWAEEKTERAVQTIALKDAVGVRERVANHADAQKQARLKYKKFLSERQQQKQGIDPNAPIKRIDNAPRPIEQKAPVKKVVPQKRTENIVAPTVPAVAAAAPAPTTATPAAVPAAAATTAATPAPADSSVNKPFVKETKVEPLLEAKPTNTPESTAVAKPSPAETPPALTELMKPIDEKSTSTGVPKVDLPALGQNEAQTNEIREQQHIQRRQQPMKRRQRSLDGPVAAPPSGSKANKAF